jgi:hypothetical protein
MLIPWTATGNGRAGVLRAHLLDNSWHEPLGAVEHGADAAEQDAEHAASRTSGRAPDDRRIRSRLQVESEAQKVSRHAGGRD